MKGGGRRKLGERAEKPQGEWGEDDLKSFLAAYPAHDGSRPPKICIRARTILPALQATLEHACKENCCLIVLLNGLVAGLIRRLALGSNGL